MRRPARMQKRKHTSSPYPLLRVLRPRSRVYFYDEAVDRSACLDVLPLLWLIHAFALSARGRFWPRLPALAIA